MHWKFGTPPVDSAFRPETEDWQRVRFPGPYVFLALATPVGVATAAILIVAWKSVLPSNTGFSISLPNLGLGPWTLLLLPIVGLVGALAVILVHELLHSVGHPGFGLSEKTTIGAWPSKLMFYAVYLGGIPRNRYLVLGLLPFCVLSLLPLAVFFVIAPGASQYGSILALVSVFNGFSSCGDLIMMPMLALQVPANAQIRDHGWDMYWKVTESPATQASTRA